VCALNQHKREAAHVVGEVTPRVLMKCCAFAMDGATESMHQIAPFPGWFLSDAPKFVETPRSTLNQGETPSFRLFTDGLVWLVKKNDNSVGLTAHSSWRKIGWITPAPDWKCYFKVEFGSEATPKLMAKGTTCTMI